MNDTLEAVLTHVGDRDKMHRWIDAQPEGARILVLSNTSEEAKDVHRYCCSDNLLVKESNWMLDVYKQYLMDSTTL